MDLEGGNEDLEMEQDEFEGFESLDAGNPAEAQEDSAEAHDARIKPSPVLPTAEEVAKHIVLSGAGVRHASPPVQRKILIREERSALLRWACQWCKWIMISWRSS